MAPTLIPAPPPDPAKSPIENALEITALAPIGPNIFTNARRTWLPVGARGIYGGTVIAQALSAGQRTVADNFLPHSCHCYFLLAGSADIPLVFYVELVRDGRSFATRTIQARQRGRCIFTMTVSFMRDDTDSTDPAAVAKLKKRAPAVRHQTSMPMDPATGQPLQPPPDDWEADIELGLGPFQSYTVNVSPPHNASPAPSDPSRTYPPISSRGAPETLKSHHWQRARGRIAGGLHAQLAALAYVSDSWFIGTIVRIHKLWRFPFPVEYLGRTDGNAPSALPAPPPPPSNEKDGNGNGSSNEQKYGIMPTPVNPVARGAIPTPAQSAYARGILKFEGHAEESDEEIREAWKGRPGTGMMVSLDHSIYFHAPRRVKVDEWFFSEMESPWAGDDRGVVVQRIFARDGTLLASCYQEGVVRLRETDDEKEAKSKL